MERKWICLFFALSIFTNCVPASQAVQQTKEEISWGFDEKSAQLQKNGAFRNFVPKGYQINQAVCNDLDLDGIDDVLLVLIPSSDYDFKMLITLLLKGKQNGSFEQIKKNEEMIYFSGYDGSEEISSSKAGSFQISKYSALSLGGYEYHYLFEYNKKKQNWFLTEYFYSYDFYSNSLTGKSQILTPANFCEVSFDNFKNLDIYKGHYFFEKDSTKEDNSQISFDYCTQIILADKEKEKRINALIIEDMKKVETLVKNQLIPIQIFVSSTVTFQNPDIISIEYEILNSSQYIKNNKTTVYGRFTTNIDIASEKILSLEDIIEPTQLAQIAVNLKFSEDNFASNYGIAFSQTQEELEQRFLQTNQTKMIPYVCFSIYEQSLCIYWISDTKHIKRYISKEELMDYLKFNPWKTKSKAAEHFIWGG